MSVFSFTAGEKINIGAQLHPIVHDGYISIDEFNNECNRIANEVQSHVKVFDAHGLASGNYLRVSNMTVGNKINNIRSIVENHLKNLEEEEVERIKKNVTDKVMKRVKTPQKSPQKSPFGFKRKDPKMSAISRKAKELGVRDAEKRKRNDSSSVDENESEKKKRMKERREERGRREGRRRRKERREERERRESSEEAGTSREKINDKDNEKVEKQWCAFCADHRFHTAINCSKYKTWNERRTRMNILKLCIHCLDKFDPISCKRKEHQILCTNCHKHTSHPSLCKLLLPPSFIKSPIRYKKKNFAHSFDRRTGRND